MEYGHAVAVLFALWAFLWFWAGSLSQYTRYRDKIHRQAEREQVYRQTLTEQIIELEEKLFMANVDLADALDRLQERQQDAGAANRKIKERSKKKA